MKKMKLLALAGAVSVMLMGVGYAAWNDSIQINNTITSGQMDVAFHDQRGAEFKPGQISEFVTTGIGYATHAVEGNADQNNWDVANVTLGNLYPGAKASVYLRVDNNSTIPVKISSMDTTVNDLRSSFGVGACAWVYDKDGNELKWDNNSVYANPFEPAHWTNTRIPVGGYIIVEYDFTANDNIVENATYNFNFSPKFKQFNK